jgi:hypothetical protein
MATGIKKARTLKPDLILMDIKMQRRPEPSGIDGEGRAETDHP